MPRSRSRMAFLVAAAMVASLAACGDLSQITDPTTSNATLTLWTSDPAPSFITVLVDGTQVGTLTQYRYSTPDCGAASSGATITLTLQAGQHTISAYETSSTGTWGPAQVNIGSGKCLTYEFQP